MHLLQDWDGAAVVSLRFMALCVLRQFNLFASFGFADLRFMVFAQLCLDIGCAFRRISIFVVRVVVLCCVCFDCLTVLRDVCFVFGVCLP